MSEQDNMAPVCPRHEWIPLLGTMDCENGEVPTWHCLTCYRQTHLDPAAETINRQSVENREARNRERDASEFATLQSQLKAATVRAETAERKAETASKAMTVFYHDRLNAIAQKETAERERDEVRAERALNHLTTDEIAQIVSKNRIEIADTYGPFHFEYTGSAVYIDTPDNATVRIPSSLFGKASHFFAMVLRLKATPTPQQTTGRENGFAEGEGA